jgi:hypothetical protein
MILKNFSVSKQIYDNFALIILYNPFSLKDEAKN